jgi:ATP-dependent RNA helicase SUPV3L1/SUV3
MSPSPSRISAVLGPTNTGKTHYAIERMLGYRTGVIGLPLRLLAREVYDKLVALRGPSVVALVTGEERIVPGRAQYWVCTVEAMPQDIGADFVAVDEIQLCADPERGHVFTDRLLHMRGRLETVFLGSDTMRGAIARLVPKTEFIRRERLSELTYTGAKKLSRMPARSAIVGFSLENVYAIAELLRRQKGGAAVVMGALSPRTRNAQVEMYQSGDVEFLVATDAIGMGLNLDVKHVAFSGLSKFDGRRMRRLMPNELSQIAGRAGRYMNSGTFGVTGEASALDQQVVDAIENHRFTPIKRLQWRNSTLDFRSPYALMRSLQHAPDDPVLVRAREADDQLTLQMLAALPEVLDRCRDGTSVRLLWDVCQIPDFRQISASEHTSLMGQIFEFVHGVGAIPEDWLARQIKRLDRAEGDIDALSKRLAFVRTWTYVTQRKGWVSNETYWRDEARAVEDRLSDALHGALTQRFVDRRTSILMRRLKQKESLVAEVNSKGEVTVEGEFVGRLNGFRFQLDKNASEQEARTLRAAATQALQPEFKLRADRLYNAPDTEFEFTEQGGLMWGENAVGKLVAGADIMSPMIEAFVDEEAGADVAQKVQRRLGHFLERKINAAFEPLIALSKDETVTGLARGVAFRLVESLGVIPRSVIANDVKELDQDARGMLRKHGVRFGQYTIYQQLMLKPAPTRLRLVLWSLQEGLEEFPEAPPAGLVTIPALAEAPKGYYPRAGYRLAGARAIRIDMLERLADMIRSQDSRAGFEATADMLSITGMTFDQFADLMDGLGYAVEKGEREKVRPEPVAEPTAEAPETAQATEVEHAAGAPETDAEAKQDAALEPAPETSDEPSVESPAEAVSEPGATEPEVPEVPELETFYVFRWQAKPRPAKQADRPARAKKPRRDTAKDKPKGKSHKSPPPRKEKPIDPDNPFAALMALKQKS